MQIESKTGVIRLVKQAQCGDSEAMSQLSQQVADRVLPSAGIKTDNSNAIIEITTSSSIRVNAFIFLLIAVSPS